MYHTYMRIHMYECIHLPTCMHVECVWMQTNNKIRTLCYAHTRRRWQLIATQPTYSHSQFPFHSDNSILIAYININ